MEVNIKGKTYPARKNPQTEKLEGVFALDLNHDWQMDMEIDPITNKEKPKTAWADLQTGFGFIEKDGKKQYFHVDDMKGGILVGHSGQLVEADELMMELYKNPDGSWACSNPQFSPADFTYDQEDPQPPYGLSKEQIPPDADQEIFGVKYEYEKEVNNG